MIKTKKQCKKADNQLSKEKQELVREYSETIKQINGFKAEEATREVLELYRMFLKTNFDAAN